MALYVYGKEDGMLGKTLCVDTPTTQRGVGGALPTPAGDKVPTCIEKRPPLLAGADARPEGPWPLVGRQDGTRQRAYQGHPLYSSIKDEKPGYVNGPGIGRGGGQDRRPAFASTRSSRRLKLTHRRKAHRGRAMRHDVCPIRGLCGSISATRRPWSRPHPHRATAIHLRELSAAADGLRVLRVIAPPAFVSDISPAQVIQAK